VSQVSRAIASIQVDSSAKSTVTAKSAVVLYDAKNNQLNLKNIKIYNQNVTVTMPILKTKQAQLSVDYLNLPAGFDKSNIKCTITPKEITAAGEENIINALTTVKLDSIDFSTLDITNTLSDTITMPNGVINVDNITSASLTVSLANTSTKTLSTKDFNVINIPNGYSVKVRTTQLNNIKLFGPSSDIGNVSTVTATVDMSSINIIEGTYEVPVTISVPSKTGYWVTGKYNVTINSWRN
jgi:YbbR domain-containing protein